MIVVAVHYSTLTEKALFSNYASVCQSLDRRATLTLVLNIKDFPQDISTSKLASAATALSPFSRLRMIQMRKPDLGSLDLREAGIALVATEYDTTLGAFYRDPFKCRKFVRKVHEAGARIVVDRVTRKDGGHLFRDLDVDFISYELATDIDDWG